MAAGTLLDLNATAPQLGLELGVQGGLAVAAPQASVGVGVGVGIGG